MAVLLAYAAATIRRPKWLRSIDYLVSAAVAANLGGIPLAFAFIALIGRQGLGTKILSAFGFDLYGNDFQIDSTWGFTTVYAYFQIPLMVLITLPAIDGLKSSWRESAANLGGTSFTYWRRIGLPVLAPSLLGGFLLALCQRLQRLRDCCGTDQTSPSSCRYASASICAAISVPVRSNSDFRLRPGWFCHGCLHGSLLGAAKAS